MDFAFDATDSQPVFTVPGRTALRLRHLMLGMLAPIPDRREAAPVRHRDPHTMRITDSFDAQKPRLRSREFDHSVGHRSITFRISRGTDGSKDDGMVRRFGSVRDVIQYTALSILHLQSS